MISEAERNYECKTWTKIDEVPEESRSLNPQELFYFCTSESGRFSDLIKMEKADRAFLLDYEMLSLGYEPACGSMIRQMPDGCIVFTIFTEHGSDNYIQER